MQVENLIAEVCKALVDHPSDVSVKKIDGEQTIVYELKVHPADLGKIIGRNGAMVQSIRTLLRAASPKLGKRLVLEIIE